MTNCDAHAAVVVGAFGCGGQQFDRVGGDRAGDTLDRTELADQFRCGRRVVGAIVETGGEVGHRLGDAGVAAGACRLGQRLVRGIANRVAAELPTPAVHFEQTEVVELANVGRIELLVELFGKGLQRGDRSRTCPSVAAFSMIWR